MPIRKCINQTRLMNKAYSPLPNSFRRDILAGKPLIGCWASLANATTTEILGMAGFDWILIDGEHAPNELNTFIPQLMALKDSPSAPVVRPQSVDPILIKRLLDIGFANFLMPQVDAVEQAQLAVSATRYPPEGIRGVSVGHRANRYGYVSNYYQEANDNISVCVQIESRTAVENVAAIAAVEGIDGLFIGPSDLSAAYGHFGELEHPEIKEAIEVVYAAGSAAGKAVGILAPVPSDAERYLEMGMTLVAVGSDLGLFRKATMDLRERFPIQ